MSVAASCSCARTAGRQTANVSQTHTHQAPYSTTRPTRDRNTHTARKQAADVSTYQIHTRQRQPNSHPPAALHSTIRPTRDRNTQTAHRQAADVNTNQIHNRAILHYSTHAEKKQAECRLRARRRTLCTPSARKRCYAPIIFRVEGRRALASSAMRRLSPAWRFARA